MNTRADALLTVQFTYVKPAAGGAIEIDHRVANMMHIVLHSDYTIEIFDTSVGVFDYAY